MTGPVSGARMSSLPPPLAPPPVVGKKSSAAKTVAIVVAAGMLCLLLGGALLYLLTVYEIPEDVREEDRSLLFTAEDLAEIIEMRVHPGAEPRRVRHLDRSVEIEYEYDAVDDEEQPIHVYTNITYEPRASDALIGFEAIALGTRIGAALESIDHRPCANASPIKDRRSRCAELWHEDDHVGTVVTILVNKVVLHFAVIGFGIDPEWLFPAFEDRVSLAERWKPAAEEG